MAQQVLGGRYLLQDKVGSGGMATVFRAQDQVLGRTVAVKIMLPQYASDPQFAARFKQEAQAAAALQSPYIVGIYDWGKDGETYYIVMEYLRGTDLKSGIRSHGALDPQKVAQIGSQICGALSVAHKHEIIHRDIKPQNIMVQPDGNIKVMDFGIARAKNSHLTQDNNVLGTAHYVSPEQTRGQALGPTSDLYSLGVVMYECATGRVPFDGDDAISVALKQVNELPVPPSQINPKVDGTLERIILKCMEKDPAARFQSADELRQVLNSYIAGRAVDVAEPTRVIAGAGMGATQTQVMSQGATTAIPRAGGAARTQASIGQTGSYNEDPDDKGRRNKIIAGVVVGVVAVIALIVLAVSIFGGGAKKTTVPNVINQTQEQATQAIQDANLNVGRITTEFSDTVPEGSVISTDPAGNTEVDEGSEVALVVSKGEEPPETVKVPDYDGMTADEYAQALEDAGLTGVRSNEASDSIDEDNVIRIEGASVGEEVEKGTSITYYVSTGPESSNIPGVIGMSESKAKNTLTNAGFKVSVNREYSSEAEGTVIDQTTGSAESGSTVTITVSRGPEPTPDPEPTTPDAGDSGSTEDEGTDSQQ